MKHVFIIKPISKVHPFISVIKDVMKDRDYDIVMSLYPHHCHKIIKNYQEPVRIYSVGGDGFLNDVLQAVVNTEHELVDIPYGTGNDFSKYVNGDHSPRRILEDSLTKTAQKVDVMKINERYSINIICFGIDALIANKVHENGHSSYVLSLVKRVAGYPFYHVKMMNNDVIVDDNITICVIANASYYGGGFCISPESNIQDGELEIVVLPKINKMKAPYYISQILNKKIIYNKDIIYKKIKSVDVFTQASANVDGEEMKDLRYHIEVIPSAVKVVI